jgi:hypothetical protein
MIKHLLTAGLVAVLSPLPVLSQNLVNNGDFDENVGGWINFSTQNGILEWTDFDWQESPDSGSMLVTNTSTQPPSSSGAGALQAGIPFPGGEYYTFRGRGFVPADQGLTGNVTMEIQFYSQFSSACSGHITNEWTNDLVEIGTWGVMYVVGRAPAATACIRIALETYKDQVGGSFRVYFDGIRLLPSELFSDGFETGDTGGWSGSVGGSDT